MENQEHFGRLTDRMATFREEVLEEKPYIDAERAVLATQAYKENQNQPRVMVRALMLQKILENMSIYIEDKSLIAGNQATKNKNAPIFPEYTMEFVMNELDLFEKRDGDVFYITEETKQQLRDIAPFWENNNLRARGEALLPDEVSVFMETGVFGMEGKLNAGDAHLAVNYERILAEGLKGYEERTKKLKAALDFTKPESIDKNVFYKAVLIVIDAVHTFANRYSKLAQDMALTETDAKRKEELLEISRICTKVPYEPASSFREAVQAVWFLLILFGFLCKTLFFCKLLILPGCFLIFLVSCDLRRIHQAFRAYHKRIHKAYHTTDDRFLQKCVISEDTFIILYLQLDLLVRAAHCDRIFVLVAHHDAFHDRLSADIR